MKSKVAVLKVKPETILSDIERLCSIAGMDAALKKGATTILKDNISWHYPFPGANSTPWQLEGTVLALKKAGFADVSCVQNKTVVTNAFKGEDLNHYVPIFQKYGIPVLYNFKESDMKWVEYHPKAKMHVLSKIFPDGIHVPDYFFGKNIVHLPTVKCVAGDTEIVLADGTVTTVRDIVSQQLTSSRSVQLTADGTVATMGSVDLYAMSPERRIGIFTARGFSSSSREGKTVLRLRTHSGETLVATSDHRVFTMFGWRELGKLCVGDRIGAAKARRFSQAVGHDVSRVEMATDLAWDHVAEISEVDGDVDLYDISVPGADCFIANGLVVHNCHIYTTTTGAMKNAFGGLLATHRHYTHTWIHKTLVDLLAIQKEIHSGLFAIMDGTTAGNGPGPRTMFPVIKDYMLASADQVAIDAVAAKMMGFDPMSLEYIKVAHDDGLGVGDPRDIEIVGADISKESWGFQVGDNGASKVGDLMWFGPMKRFQKLFFHTPLVNAFIFGSEFYHDYYRWPMKDKKTFEDWKANTSWGRLFGAYERGESQKIALSVQPSAE